jgi:hypothetical protein
MTFSYHLNRSITIHIPPKKTHYHFVFAAILLILAISMVVHLSHSQTNHLLECQLFLVALLIDCSLIVTSIKHITLSMLIFSFLVLRLLLLILTFSKYSQFSELFQTNTFDDITYDITLLWYLITNACLFISIGIFFLCMLIWKSKKN